MPYNNVHVSRQEEFQKKLVQVIFIIGFLFVLPLSISHSLDGRNILGIGTFIISILFLIAAWVGSKKQAWFTQVIWVIVPIYSFVLSYASRDQGLMILFWCYPTVVAIHFLLPLRQGFLANGFFLALMLPAAWDILEPMVMLRFVLTLTCIIGFSVFFVFYIKKQRDQLETLAITDSLTGLLNRVALKDKLEHMMNQNMRLGSDMTLVSIDLDYFKKINDEYGHDKGDEVLIAVSHYLKQRMRGVDLVFRMGGEEFLLLLFNCNSESAKKVAEEIRINIHALTLIPELKLSASFGVASLISNESQKDWLKRCDQKLYLAKEQGRNQVVS